MTWLATVPVFGTHHGSMQIQQWSYALAIPAGLQLVGRSTGDVQVHLIKAAAAEPDCVSLLPGIGHMEHHHCRHLKPLNSILVLSIAWQDTKPCWQLGVKHKRQSPALHHFLQVRSHICLKAISHHIPKHTLSNKHESSPHLALEGS